MTTLAIQAHAQTYEDVKHLIYKIIHRFQRKHGGDFDNMLSVAHEAYVTAYDRWDRKTARFSTYLYHRVWGLLMTDRNKQLRRARRIPTADVPTVRDDEMVGLSLDQVADKNPVSLTQDAIEVVRLLTDVPRELIRKELRNKNAPRELMLQAYRHLRGIGWTFARVAESFAEMRKVVTG